MSEQPKLLKPLLCAVALKAGKQFSATDIHELFLTCPDWPRFERTDDKYKISVSVVQKWITNDVCPGDKRLEAMLSYCNHLLFGVDKSNHIPGWDTAFESIRINERLRDSVVTLLSAATGTLRHIPWVVDHRQIDPGDLDQHVLMLRPKSALKSHALYHSPVAARIWERITTQSPYKRLYQACEQGLAGILRTGTWGEIAPQVGTIFSLGAGSPSKDRTILGNIEDICSRKPTYVLVDASLYMLANTLKDIETTGERNVNVVALATDFEHPKRMMSQLRTGLAAFPKKYSNDGRNAFFILGFTLSNLDEDDFFEAYAGACEPGDLLIFPMQFIPGPEGPDGEAEVLGRFERDLRAHYNFSDGMKLARSALRLLQEFEPVPGDVPPGVEPEQFQGKNRSRRIEFKARVVDGDGHERTVITAKSSRHYRSDYLEFLTAKGFRLLDEAVGGEKQDGVVTLLVERMK